MMLAGAHLRGPQLGLADRLIDALLVVEGGHHEAGRAHRRRLDGEPRRIQHPRQQRVQRRGPWGGGIQLRREAQILVRAKIRVLREMYGGPPRGPPPGPRDARVVGDDPRALHLETAEKNLCDEGVWRGSGGVLGARFSERTRHERVGRGAHTRTRRRARLYVRGRYRPAVWCGAQCNATNRDARDKRLGRNARSQPFMMDEFGRFAGYWIVRRTWRGWGAGREVSEGRAAWRSLGSGLADRDGS
eukprot:1191974-Prorocentrum_minimum.AAC.7